MFHMKVWKAIVIVCILQLTITTQSANSATFEDLDRDGLDDRFEQELLEKFAPAFQISADDCDGSPAEFLAGSSTPVVVAKNGTIYGQVSQHSGDGSNRTFLEIHYYHLWNRDCGRLGHALDTEHVATLVNADHMEQTSDAWRAVYWYAAAHEDTVCDVSHGAHADVVEASHRGPTIWISDGKHASFLGESKCRLGCGENRCKEMMVLDTPEVINIGESGSPLNGAVWTGSEDWPLKRKMKTDFPPATLERLRAVSAGSVVALNTPPPPTHAVILGSNSTFGAFLIGNQSAGRALSIAGPESLKAVASALTHTGRSLLIVGRTLRRLIGKRAQD